MLKPFYAFLLPALAMLAACEAPEPKTRLDFVAGTGLTSESRTIAAGEIITTSLFARSPSADNKLKQFIVSRIYDTLTNSPVVQLDTTFTAGEFGMTLVFGSRGVNNQQPKGKEYWNFKLIDEKGQEYQKQYVLTTTYPNYNQPINSFSSYYFNRNARENIRYYSTKEGLGFPAYIGRNHPDADFYFEEGPQLTLNLQALNGTTFRATTLTPAQFSATSTASTLTTFYNNAGPDTDSQPGLRKDNIIAFKTGQDKIGLIQIGTFEVGRDSLQKVNILRRVPFQVKVRK